MGYRTRVSEPGPDRGVDTFVSPDGLGLQKPHIFCEVKPGMGEELGAQEIRFFLGGCKPAASKSGCSLERGLYSSSPK
nr:restriction endonuclease [Corallococcus macrosporus]